MTEVLFYHLQHQPLERVLPVLLEKTLERGWNAVVQTGDADRMVALDTALWTYDEQSFLPHGVASEPNGARQPIALTDDSDNVNGAQIRFFVEAAEPTDVSGYERVVFMFNGHDEKAVGLARKHWKLMKDQGHEATYWQQDERGRWIKKA